LKAFGKLKAKSMDIDRHAFLDALEQVKELLKSPDIASRTDGVFLTETLSRFYELIDEYALEYSDDPERPEDPEKIKEILEQVTTQLNAIDEHVTLNQEKLKFLSKISPKT
jgi:ribosome assembly protein YihI (activator of Der GTPase)